MRKILFAFASMALLFASCGDDDYERGVRAENDSYVPIPAVPGRVVLAYATYYGEMLPDPNACTHIAYAFAELYVESGVYKGFKLQGDESHFQKVVNLKSKNPSLKILISFTHTVDNADNAQGGGFSALAKSDTYRKAFANDCKAFCATWGLDGVDIDWELPGLSWSGHACDPAVDTQNHVLLMKQLRETLGSNYLLTYAGYVKDKEAIAGGYRNVDVKAVDPYVDFVNIMTYDIASAPQHQSALDDPASYWDCKRSVDAYINAGVPANKLVMGIPFYGRHSFDATPQVVDYRDIVNLGSDYKIDNWDAAANVPYVTHNGTYFCGYDNEKSIGIKGEWILAKGMKGLMYWDAAADDNAYTLSHAVWEAVMKQ